MGIIFCKCVCLNIIFRFRGFFTPGEVVNASSLGILACYKYPGHGCIYHCICLSKMSGKKQISILSFAQRGKPLKKARLGPEKVVNTLEEEMVEVEETVQVEEEETVQVEEGETVQVEEEETVQVEEEETVEETVEEMARTKGRKVPEAATYKTSFNSEWTSKWPCITVGSTSSYYWCSICRQETSCAHPGVRDVTRHIVGASGQTAGTEVNQRSQKLLLASDCRDDCARGQGTFKCIRLTTMFMNIIFPKSAEHTSELQ